MTLTIGKRCTRTNNDTFISLAVGGGVQGWVKCTLCTYISHWGSETSAQCLVMRFWKQGHRPNIKRHLVTQLDSISVWIKLRKTNKKTHKHTYNSAFFEIKALKRAKHTLCHKPLHNYNKQLRRVHLSEQSMSATFLGQI